MIIRIAMFLIPLLVCFVSSAEMIKVGLAGTSLFSEESYNDEFVKYNPYAAFMAKNGIQIHLIDSSSYCGKKGAGSGEWTDQELESILKQNHVVYLSFEIDASHDVKWFKERLMKSREIIKRYVQDGGGLVLQPISVRYNGMEKYYECWNAFLEPFGMEILNEGLYDKTRSYEGKSFPCLVKPLYWQTGNIVKHPMTEGVSHLFLPLNNASYLYPGVCLVKYSPDWQILVKGEKEAQSYKCIAKDGWSLDVTQDGSCSSEPPVLAAREFGKGRIVCYPLGDVNSYTQFGMSYWDHVVELNGDGKTPSDSTKLWLNAFRWCAEPAMKNKELGTFIQKPYEKVSFPKTTPDWDQFKFGVQDGGVAGFQYPDAQRFDGAPASDGVRGLVGAHTAYSDGQGTVAEYVEAAKKAGLSFIVFTESLESLSSDEFESLKKDCAAQSKGNEFYACPGFEYQDRNDCRWVIWGEKIKYPPATQEISGKKYVQWDGKKINQFGAFLAGWNFIPNGSALISIADFRSKGCHPEKLWWYFTVLPFAYDGDKLIADNFNEYLSSLRDLRWNSVSSFTRIKTPADLAKAAKTCFTGYKDLPSAVVNLNTSGSGPLSARRYASQGPVIAQWEAIDSQMEYNWRYTKGAQRVRLKFVVRSDAGIQDVKIHDADLGVYRRFLGNGAKELSREFEAVDDRQHEFVLDVTDVNGKRAVSQYVFVFAYKNGHFRCGDNLNMLDTTGMPIHPDREQMLSAIVYPFWLSDQMLLVDGGGSLYPIPFMSNNEAINIKGIGAYPAYPTAQGKILDVRLSSYTMVIDRMRFDKFSDYSSEERSASANGWPNRDIAENEYFTRTHTMFTPNGRGDNYVRWNYRRGKEGSERYEGNLYLHEGEIKFKKDAVLDGSVPIPLVAMQGDFDKARGFGGTLAVVDRDKGPITVSGDDAKKPAVGQGHLAPGGYAAVLPYGKLHVAFYASPENDYVYSASLPGSPIQIGLGESGMAVKAGDVIKYQYATALFLDKGDSDILKSGRLTQTSKVLNLAGKKIGYPVNMKAGEIVDSTFFLTVKAKGNEAAFTVGPEKLNIDLPIRIEGVADNGCVAVFSSDRKWFLFVPVYEGTAYFQESIDEANEIWAGNLVLCDNKDVRITAVIDGQKEGAEPWIEVHNPTDKEISAKIWSPEHAPLFGAATGTVKIPAGDSVKMKLKGKEFKQ